MADHHGDDEPPKIDPKLLRLPPGLEGTGDPVDVNPFPEGTTRHHLWARASRDAEEKIARLKSEWLRWQDRQRQKHPVMPFEIVQWNEEFQSEKRRVLLDEFQIWSARAIQAILTGSDVQAFDRWVVEYAAAFLQLQADQMLAYLPPHLVEGQIRPLREELTALVFHVKAEARKACAFREQEQAVAAAGHTTSLPSEDQASEERPQPGKRAIWLNAALNARRWTPKELERRGGPDAKTTRRILAGKPVRETVLEKLAQALSHEGRVNRRDIPD